MVHTPSTGPLKPDCPHTQNQHAAEMWACAVSQMALFKRAVSLTKPSQPSCGEGLYCLLYLDLEETCVHISLIQFHSSTPEYKKVQEYRLVPTTTAFSMHTNF